VRVSKCRTKKIQSSLNLAQTICASDSCSHARRSNSSKRFSVTIIWASAKHRVANKVFSSGHVRDRELKESSDIVQFDISRCWRDGHSIIGVVIEEFSKHSSRKWEEMI
jgi:hypothetical protein